VAKFVVNPTRFDPYRNCNFRIKIDNRYVAGLNKCSALKKTTEVTQWCEAGDSGSEHKLPGRTKFEALTLEAGLTHDPTFEDWANLVNNFQGEASMSLKNFRKDVIVEVYNEAGQKCIAYKVYRCWVSEYQALPELDASANAVAITHIKLENEGWERDTAVGEPREK
jgi:phage tail-like protein